MKIFDKINGQHVGVILIMGLAVICARPVTAKENPYKTQVRKQLLKYEKPTKKQLLWASKDAKTHLIDLATDRREPVKVRVKAVDALALFKDEDTYRVLRGLVFDPLEPDKVRGAAMETIGFFKKWPVLRILKQFVLGHDRLFRLRAAQGLERFGSPEACRILMDALAREENLDTKLRLNKLYDKCVKRGKP